jgi:Domain of unknown function (DUF5667)
MTLLDRILARGVQLPMDPIVASRVERHLQRIQPDPMFRRRLRGLVVNRYVANREGMIEAAHLPSRRREAGALGRGVLVAALLTAVGVSAVGAAAQESLPGDALYAVKLSLEDLRMRIAPPGLRDDLAAMTLDERLDEVERLAAAGRWQLVDEATASVIRAEEQLSALTGGAAAIAVPDGEEAINSHAQRLEELIVTAPVSAREGLQRALQASTGGGHPTVEPPAAQPPAADPAHEGRPETNADKPTSPAEAPTPPGEPSPEPRNASSPRAPH